MTEKSEHDTRWGKGKRHEPQEARERLIDCAIVCYRAHGVQKTAMLDIAAQARVTRQTVYRYFDDQDEILRAVIQRDIEKLWQLIEKKLHHVQSLDEYLIEALLAALDYATRNPDQLITFTAETLPTLEEIWVADHEYELSSVEMLRTQIAKRASKPVASIDADIYVLNEWFNRMLASYLFRPSPLFQQPEELRRLFRRLLPTLDTFNSMFPMSR
jgi:AcrR family transcriptional regulator